MIVMQSYPKLRAKVCVHAKSLPSCPTHCDPMDCRSPGSSVLGILQARRLEWVAVSLSRGSSPPRDQIHVSYVSCIGRPFLYHWRHLGSPRDQSRGVKCQNANRGGKDPHLYEGILRFLSLELLKG